MQEGVCVCIHMCICETMFVGIRNKTYLALFSCSFICLSSFIFLKEKVTFFFFFFPGSFMLCQKAFYVIYLGKIIYQVIYAGELFASRNHQYLNLQMSDMFKASIKFFGKIPNCYYYFPFFAQEIAKQSTECPLISVNHFITQVPVGI